MTSTPPEFTPPSQTRRIAPTKRSVRGIYAFGGEGIWFESTLERDFLIRTHCCFEVQSFVAQPVQVPFVGQNGQTYLYTPDFLVTFAPHERRLPLLVEVKPEAEWRQYWRQWSSKWKAADRHARARGWTFRIHDESRIRDAALVNARFLNRYTERQADGDQAGVVLAVAQELGQVAFGTLRARTGASQTLLWHLMVTRQLAFDARRPLDADSQVWVRDV